MTVNLQQQRPALHWVCTGTMTITSVEVWREIKNTPQLRLRLPDGQEGSFDAQGAEMPPSPARPATFRITRNDGEIFKTG